MNFEPQKFFIGLMDFFSILLPGALLTYLLSEEIGPWVLQDRYYDLAFSELEGGAVFFVASYLIGHVLHLIGSWLDDLLYDPLRKRFTFHRQVARLAHREKLSPWCLRAIAWTVFKDERDLAVDRAGKIKEHMLASLRAERAINTFQWSKAYLAKCHGEGLAAVQRFEADSKFFRSFVVVALALLIFWAPQRGCSLVILVLLLGLAAMWRYMEQRYKATNQAYWSTIAAVASVAAGDRIALEPDKRSPAAIGLDEAAGVVWRRGARGSEFLLLEDRQDPKLWGLPGARIEGEEHPRETAVRGVREETGVWAKIIDECLGEFAKTDNEKTRRVKYYLMEAVSSGPRRDRAHRERKWLGFDQVPPLKDEKERALIHRAARFFSAFPRTKATVSDPGISQRGLAARRGPSDRPTPLDHLLQIHCRDPAMAADSTIPSDQAFLTHQHLTPHLRGERQYCRRRPL